MTRFYITFCFAASLLAFLPLAPHMAVSASAPLYTHFVYPFAHANIFHWACNAWSLLVLHNALRPSRCLVAYLLAAVVSFLLPSARPVLGASVFVTFFLGFAAAYLWHHDRRALLLTLALLAVTCVLPQFAAAYHIAMFLLGLAWFFIDSLIRNFIRYAKD